MTLRKRLAKLAGEYGSAGKACTCTPPCFVMTFNDARGGDGRKSSREAASPKQRCPECGGEAEGFHVVVMREG